VRLTRCSLFQRQIVEQPFARQVQEIKSKLGILQVELLDLVVTDAKQLSISRTFNGGSSRLARIQQSELTKNLTNFEIDASLPDPESA